ncbi:hypothetical protein D3C76_1443560 [compost metagenome]
MKLQAPTQPACAKAATQVIGDVSCACGCERWSISKLTENGIKMIEFDMNTNDSEALLRHCESFVPTSAVTIGITGAWRPLWSLCEKR